ncbi:MAG: PEP-CTERM sorting domain-containing protein [Planctomycetota bacterium]
MMYKKLIVVVLVLGLTGISQALVFEDNFDHITYPTDSWDRVNYQGWYEDQIGWPSPGGDWNIGGWDGYQSLPSLDTGVSPTLAAYNHVETFNVGMGEEPFDPDKQSGHPGNAGGTANGVLRIISTDSGWSDGWNTGAFLYKDVPGDFEAFVEVVGQSHIYHNLGGLMARKSNPDGAGENENWVYLTYFPEWNVGNHTRDTVDGASVEAGSKGFPCDPFLKLSRVGTTFYFETSPDGVTFTSLPGLEAGIDRPDLPEDLQVGIFQANYAADWIGPMDFDNFSIVPEPATIALFGLGGLALIRRKRN